MSGACALISRVACSPVSRGMPTSRMRRSGRSRSAGSTASAPSAASATTSMSGWRSSSSRSPLRTIPWSSAISDPHAAAPSRSVDGRCPRARRRVDVEGAAGEQRALAHARQPEPARCGVAREARARRRRCARPSAPDERQLDGDVLRARVLGDVGQALLDDAVDDELLVVVERPERRAGGSRAWMPGAAAEVARPARAARRAGRGRPARWGAARAPGGAAPPSPGRRGAGSRAARARSSGGASWMVACEAQQNAGERLVDLVVEVVGQALALLLLRAQHRAWPSRALGLEAVEHPVEGGVEPRDLLDVAVGRRRAARRAARSMRSMVAISRSSGAKRRRSRQPLPSRIASERGDEHGEAACARGAGRSPGCGHRPRRTGGGHQQGVDGDELREEGRGASWRMGSGPDIGSRGARPIPPYVELDPDIRLESPGPPARDCTQRRLELLARHWSLAHARLGVPRRR